MYVHQVLADYTKFQSMNSEMNECGLEAGGRGVVGVSQFHSMNSALNQGSPQLSRRPLREMTYYEKQVLCRGPGGGGEFFKGTVSRDGYYFEGLTCAFCV